MEAPKLIESIRLIDGQFYHLDLHSARMNRSCDALNITHETYDLEAYLSKYDYPKDGTYKCRILYDTRIKTIHFQHYWPKQVNSLQVVYADQIEYSIKTLQRNTLNYYHCLRRFRDDIVIVKNGFVTDSYYGNLLFLKNGNWYTPKTHLLGGVQRSYLLEQGLIEEMEIHVSDIRKFEKVKIINAMLDLDNGLEVDIMNVHVYF